MHFKLFAESNGDIIHSIYRISDEIGADWIAAIPHRLNWIHRIFISSVTKYLALNTNIPLLILPEHATGI